MFPGNIFNTPDKGSKVTLNIMFRDFIFHPEILSTHDTKNLVMKNMSNKMFPGVPFHLEIFSTHQTMELYLLWVLYCLLDYQN